MKGLPEQINHIQSLLKHEEDEMNSLIKLVNLYKEKESPMDGKSRDYLLTWTNLKNHQIAGHQAEILLYQSILVSLQTLLKQKQK